MAEIDTSPFSGLEPDLERVFPVRKLPAWRSRRVADIQRLSKGAIPEDAEQLRRLTARISDKSARNAAEGSALHYYALRDATLFYGTEDFSRLLNAAALTFDLDTLEIEPSRVVAPDFAGLRGSGLMYLVEPLTVVLGESQAMQVRYLLWESAVTAEEDGGARVSYVYWVGGLNKDDGTYITATSGIAVHIAKGGELQISRSLVPDAREGIDRVLLAAWAVLAQGNLTETEVREPEPHQVKAARKKRHAPPPPVTVVNLRRSTKQEIAAAADVAAAGERHYSHRFLVGWPKGFWKSQPCGPRQSQRRRIYIAPYVKGPDGAPLVVKERVYQW